MESKKVKEIKETLKRCGSGKDCCWGCSLQDTQNIAKCTTVLCDKALTLINELESENSKLKQHKRELQGGQQDLIKRIAELEKEKKELLEELADAFPKEKGISSSHVKIHRFIDELKN